MVQLEQLQKIAGTDYVKIQEPMSAHTTFRIGGPADFFIEVQNEKILVELIRYCRQQEEAFFVLGNGSNLLVADEGYRGVMLSTKRFSKIEFLEKATDEGKTVVRAGSGVKLSTLASQVAAKSLTGFEFASGIPGTLGGAVTMNAGAYGGEIRDVIQNARVLLQDGTILTLSKNELKLSYRHSIIQEQNMIVLEVTFAFEPGDQIQIQNKMKELNSRRREKQPLEYGSAGSTFKRPEGYFAGKLIQDAGLQGYRVGDVMVSEKHCGFVVNVGEGTYAQAMAVIKHVQETVWERFGVMLELEVRRICDL